MMYLAVRGDFTNYVRVTHQIAVMMIDYNPPQDEIPFS